MNLFSVRLDGWLKQCFPKGTQRGEWVRWLAGKRDQAKDQGWFPTLQHLFSLLVKDSPNPVPREWIEWHEPTEQQLARQRDRMRRQYSTPTFALLMIAGAVEETAASAQSLLEQTNPHWMLYVLVPEDDFRTFEALAQDRRIVRIPVPAYLNKVEQLNWGIHASAGDYLGLIDAGDQLAPFALYDCGAFLQREPSTVLLYTDEDQIAPHGGRCELRLKPNWSPTMLLGRNYIGRGWFACLDTIKELGGFVERAQPSHEWDLLLRLTDHAGPAVRHVPRCLYHRRMRSQRHETEDAAGIITDYWTRRGYEVQTIQERGRPARAVHKLTHQPRVSIVIPTQDHREQLLTCMHGLLRKTDYENIEIILVDCNSRDLQLFNDYEQWQANEPVRVVHYPGEFNYSAVCNLGASRATGEILLFLNNDIEVVQPGWLTEMVRWASLEDVGVVGAKLLYPNRRIQHAGIALAGPGLATHLFHGWKGSGDLLYGSPDDYRDCAAVTGSCQMIRRNLFEDLGGYNEQYVLCYADIALCLDVHAKGLRVVYTPFATLIHHECATRGYVDPREREDARRFAGLLASRDMWQDPFLHPGITLSYGLPTLRFASDPGQDFLLRERVGQLLVDADMAA